MEVSQKSKKEDFIMKRVVPIFLLVGAIITLSSCKISGPKVISSDGKTYEMITAEDGGRVTDDNGNLIVAATDENGNDVTEVISDNYLIVQDDKIMAPAYDLEIPEDFELKSNDTDPMLENKQGTIQFSIMDKTQFVTDFDSYVSDTYRYIDSIGLATSEIEDVTIKDIPMKRFAMSLTDDDGSQLEAFGYLAQVGDRFLMITLTSKDGGLANVTAADEFVASIDFIN